MKLIFDLCDSEATPTSIASGTSGELEVGRMNTNERSKINRSDKHWIEVNGPDKSAPIGVHFSKEKLEEGVLD